VLGSLRSLLLDKFEMLRLLGSLNMANSWLARFEVDYHA